MVSKDIFAKRLSLLREERNLSLEELARAVGTSKTTLNKYELKLREPKLSNVKAIADYFKVNLDWLVGFSEERDPILNELVISDIYRKLSENGKRELIKYANYLLSNEGESNG
jgi:transcriptional regulator with XRE-family HTH domain